ncbi:putative mitochondrial protein [Vitis vinifera]|uniref:Putative mitochondrial protein n=1 Tax=Vitis vinifera TaxID=29760 RepID=A0A438KDH6_VITVI|nr:putative mitochondrial protein [Vitis vinifera]
MDKELKALHKNKTWVLVPHTSNMHVIGSKWVFKPKLKLDGSLDHLKARVVAKGYHQVDDDILLTGSSTALVSTFIQLLSSEFEMNDLGQIHHFLGIEISQTSYGIHLSQSHYAITILERANMVDCKPMSTSLEAKTRTSSNNVVLEDPSYFKGLVGSLQLGGVSSHMAIHHWILYVSWRKSHLLIFHISLASTPTLYCDDTSALHMTINPVSHARSKHIELDYHFVRERVALGLLITQHISIEKQVVVLFTRPMSKAALNNFRTKLCLQSRHSLREGIGATKRLGVNCGTQGSDKVEHNYGSDKVENSHNSCYNSGETLKDEGVSMATISTQNEAPSVVGRAQEEAAAAGSDEELNGLLRRRQGGMPKGQRKPELKV